MLHRVYFRSVSLTLIQSCVVLYIFCVQKIALRKQFYVYQGCMINDTL